MSNKIQRSEIADEIKHLSHKEIEELYIKYMNGEKNSILVEYYKIKINPNKLITILPPTILYETLCPYCKTAMFTKRQSKSSSSLSAPPIECFDCSHKIYSNNFRYQNKTCKCESCIRITLQIKNSEKEEKQNRILEQYNISKKDPVNYIELKFLDKLFLITLFRMQTNEEFKYILSLDDSSETQSLSPTHQMDLEILRKLYERNIIIVDPTSNIDSFIINEETNSFFINKVRWIVNVSANENNRSELDEIYNKIYQELKNGIKSEWEEDLFEIIFKIPKEEILQYIYIKSKELNVSFTAEIKTREIVTQLLQDFSVREIYYFVKKSVEDAHIYYSKGLSNGKKHAANTIPNKMLSLGERAINENWNIYKYNRDSRAPRSSISKVFYDFFLQEEDTGFFKAPGKYWKYEIHPKHFGEKSTIEENSLYCSQCKSKSVTAKMTNNNLEITCKYCGNITSFKYSSGTF